jgi:uncharacterized protein DUF5655
MPEALDWRRFRDAQAERLKLVTGQDVAVWNGRIAQVAPSDPEALNAWLTTQGVTGYARQLLRWERFGYPDFMAATAGQLLDAQYGDRTALRPVYEALVAAALSLGDVTVQARKTYVSLRTARRTFARIQPTTRIRIDIGLRLDGLEPAGRLRPGRIHDSMPVQLSFETLDDLDDEALDWLRKAYERNV